MILQKKIIFYSEVLVFFLLISLWMISTVAISPPDSSVIDIRIPEYKSSYCGGANWDTITINYFVLSVANLDTEAHTLQQVILNFSGRIETNDTLFTAQTILSETGGLPVILSPLHYWSWNFTDLLRCIYTISLQLLVDEIIIDYGNIGHSDGNFPSYYSTVWTNVTYYLSSTSPATPIVTNSNSTNAIIGFVWFNLFVLILFSHKRKNRMFK